MQRLDWHNLRPPLQRRPSMCESRRLKAERQERPSAARAPVRRDEQKAPPPSATVQSAASAAGRALQVLSKLPFIHRAVVTALFHALWSRAAGTTLTAQFLA